MIFYSPTHGMIDEVTGKFTGLDYEALLEKYPGTVIVSQATAEAFDRVKACRPVTKTTEEHFQEMLEVLPPSKWRHYDDSEAFHMLERITQDIVQWFVRLGDDYYTFCNTDKLTTIEAIETVRETLEKTHGT